MRGEQQKDTTDEYRAGWENIWGGRMPEPVRIGVELVLYPEPGESVVCLVRMDQSRTRQGDR